MRLFIAITLNLERMFACLYREKQLEEFWLALSTEVAVVHQVHQVHQ